MYKTFLLLQEVMRHSHKVLRSNLEPYGLYKGQPKILGLVVRNDGISKKEIADKYKVSMATVSKTIERLEKNDFVKTQLDENDKRKRRVFITDKGLETERELVGFKKSYSEKVFRNVSDEDIKTFERVLMQMKINMTENANEAND